MSIKKCKKLGNFTPPFSYILLPPSTQAADPQQKAELKNQLNDVNQEISERTQKQLKDFAEQNPESKQPDPESNQSLKR